MKYFSHILQRKLMAMIAISALIAAASMVTACTQDSCKDADGDEANISVSVTNPVGVGSSRVLTAATENTISNIHILAFNNETGEMLSNGYTTADNLSSMTCKLAIAGAQETQVAVYAIANLGNPTAFSDHSITLSEFENMYVKAADADGSTQGSFSLYKAGNETPVATVANETHALMVSNKAIKRLSLAGVNFKLNLVRLVPKFVLNFYSTDVKLLSYRFCNMPTGDFIVNHAEDMTGMEYHNASEVSLDSVFSAENISYYGFKSYNAPVSSSIITNQRDRIEGKAPATAPYLDVLGCLASNKNVLYLYRIYLGGVDADVVPDATQFNILRNHDYHLNIVFSSYIHGDERAGNYSNVNADIVVTPWNAEIVNAMDMDINSVYRPVTVGDYLFSDGSWGIYTPGTATPGRHPIAVIFSTETSAIDQVAGYTHGYAMALKNVHSSGTTTGTYKWSESESDVSGIPNTSGNTWQTRSSDMDGYTNTTYLNSTDYPAGYAAKTTYASQATAPSNSSGWFLPSSGQWYWILKNLGGMSATPGNTWGWSDMSSTAASNLNSKLSKVGSGNYDAFFSNTSSHEIYWSSSEVSSSAAYGAYFVSGDDGAMRFAGYDNGNKSSTFRVRAVLAF